MAGEEFRRGGPWFFIAGFVIFSLFGWVVFPKFLFSEQHQPIAFNHVIHGAEAGLSCVDCHYFRADGSYAGIPTIDMCMECHEPGTQELEGKAAEEEAKLQQYAEEGKAIPWLIYSKQPDNVYFSHAAHVKMAKIECNTCHFDMKKMAHPPLYKKNRLDAYSKQTMAMETCEACHQERGKLNDCFVCHK